MKSAHASTSDPHRLDLSLVAPVRDEQDNLRSLHQQILEVLGDRLGWELLLVDDGSADGSVSVIRELVAADPRVRGIVLERKCGQTAAMAAGIRAARAPLIATLDADLQNDPADLPGMLAALPGHDAVVGWRTQRHDSLVRRLSSRIANAVRNVCTGDHVRDTGCSLKLFRAEAIRAIPLFEGMHRFLPTLLRYHGFSVIEHPVSHRPRVAGRSKYGIGNRAWRATRDLVAVTWMRRRALRPAIREVIERGAAGAPVKAQGARAEAPGRARVPAGPAPGGQSASDRTQPAPSARHASH